MIGLLQHLIAGNEIGVGLFIKGIVLAWVVHLIAGNADSYTYYVVNLLNGIGTGASKAITGTFGGTGIITADSFDNLALRMMGVGVTVWKNIPSYSWAALALMSLILAAFFIASQVAIFLMFGAYACAFLITAFALGLGPIFIAAYFFPFFRPFFFGWLGATVGGVVAQIIVVAVLSMFLSVVVTVVDAGLSTAKSGDGAEMVTQAYFLILAAIAAAAMAYMTYRLLAVANRITGGGVVQYPSLPMIGGGWGGGSGDGHHLPAPSVTPALPAPAGSPSRQFAFQNSTPVGRP
jgi:type IV secretory pathway VirB6-like protein